MTEKLLTGTLSLNTNKQTHPRHKGVFMLNLSILTGVQRMIMRASKMMFCQSVLMANFQTDEDSVQNDENNNETNKNLSESTKKCLYDIFSDDAVVKKTVKIQELRLIKPRNRFLRLVTEQENQIFWQLFQKTILLFFLWMKKLKNIWKFLLWIL